VRGEGRVRVKSVTSSCSERKIIQFNHRTKELRYYKRIVKILLFLIFHFKI